MHKLKFMILFFCCFIFRNLVSQTLQFVQRGEEFSGPFKSWKNVKTDFGAKGDVITNDATSINAALASIKSATAKDSFNLIYFPAGIYLITDTLYNADGGYDGMSIIGGDPATTIISWNGRPGGNMFQLQGWYLRVCRLTFDGKY